MKDFPRSESRPVQETAEAFLSFPLSGTRKEEEPSSSSLVNPTTKEVMNRDNHSHELIVSGIHLELTPSLKTFVREKADRLFRHEERIVRIRVDIECDQSKDVSQRFSAKGLISIYGPDLNASVTTDDCHKSICLLIDKLDRMLRRRSRLHKVKRNHPHAIELDTELPKAV
jgi:putative sigma-54 modulation protein